MTCVENDLLAVNIHKCSVVHPSLENGDAKCRILCDLVEGLSSLQAFLGESLQGRQRIGQQLYDDLCVDVGTYRKRHKCCFREVTARDNVQIAQYVTRVLALLEPYFQLCRIQIGDRYSAAYPVYNEDEKCK